MQDIGKSLITFGLVFLALGGLFLLGDKLPFFGRLPGDIYIKKDNFTIFFPITTMIVVSVVLSLIFNIVSKR
jgi:hypothetical protein